MRVTTIYGDMDDALLTKKEGGLENDHELTTWVEYYHGEELVHRSVHVRLKEQVHATPLTQSFQ